jgi:hypothetical protein
MVSPIQQLANWLPTIGWSSIIGFVLFLCKLGWKANGFLTLAQTEWKTLRADLGDVKVVLVAATSNHLEHIQRATEDTFRAVDKQTEAITDLRLVLVDLNGFLRGQATRK